MKNCFANDTELKNAPAHATLKMKRTPSLFRRAVILLGCFFTAVIVVSVGLWWLMSSGQGMQWAQKVIHKRFPTVQGISPQALNARLEQPDGASPPPLIIDVRTAEEQEVSTLRNARCVSPEDSADTVLAGMAADRLVVVYCTGGFRAAAMAQRLMEAGRAEVRNLEGGIIGWVNAGFPVEKDGRVVPRVHPYSSLFARMVKDLEKEK